MQMTFTDFLRLSEGIRVKLHSPEFTAYERDVIIFALGLLGARVPGKLEDSKSIAVSPGSILTTIAPPNSLRNGAR